MLGGTALSSTQVSVCSSEQKRGIWQLPAKSAEFSLLSQSLLPCCMSLRCRGKQRAPPSTCKLAEELEGPKGGLEVFWPAGILKESRVDLFWDYQGPWDFILGNHSTLPTFLTGNGTEQHGDSKNQQAL